MPLFIGKFVQGGRGHISNYAALDHSSTYNEPLSVSIHDNVLEYYFPMSDDPFRNQCSRYPGDWGWCFKRVEDLVSIARSFDRHLGYRDELGRLTLGEYHGDLFAQVQDVNSELFGSKDLHETYTA